MTPSDHSLTEGRSPGFVYRPTGRGGSSSLHCEQIPISQLIKQFKTPLYVYSASMISERYTTFDAAFREIPHTICYSVKANSNLSILKLLAKLDCGFDVVSGGELDRVLTVSRNAARKTVFSGVGKTREEIAAAIKARILMFNVESESELRVLAECASRLRTTAQLALRINPDVAAKTHPYISTGLHQHKFGVPIAEARGLYAEAARCKYLKVAGVSVHIGSQITEIAPFGEAMKRVADFVRDLRREGHRIDYIDAGGGLGISYNQSGPDDFARNVANYANAVAAPLASLKINLLLEPGRSIIGPAGILATSVLYRKSNGGKRFVVVDAAMTDLIRPALYGAHHQIIPVKQSAGTTNLETVDVVGPVCETGDFFARDREMQPVQEGDALAILDVGAYGMVLTSNYNSRPRPPELLVSRKKVTTIRKRENVKDLMRAEL
jgi:diaminopimelate decarboxylase